MMQRLRRLLGFRTAAAPLTTSERRSIDSQERRLVRSKQEEYVTRLRVIELELEVIAQGHRFQHGDH